MVNLNPLRRLTEELAKEVAFNEDGPRLRLIELLLDNIDTPAIIVTSSHHILFMNKSIQSLLNEIGVKAEKGQIWYEAILSIRKLPEEFGIDESLRKKNVSTGTVIFPLLTKRYDVSCVPLVYNGVSGWIILFNKERV